MTTATAFLLGLTFATALGILGIAAYVGFHVGRFYGWWVVPLVVLFAFPGLAQDAQPAPLAPVSTPGQGLMLTVFIQYLLPVLMTGLSALLSWAMMLGVGWLKTKGETSKAMLAVATLAEGARSAVANAEATIKADLIEASKDGVITKEEGERIKAHVLEELKKMPAPVLKAAASLFGGNVEGYLSGLIERTLATQKAALPAASPAPAASVPVPAITAPVGP